MPKVNSLETWVYPVKSNVAKPLRKTPYDQTQARPTSDESAGKIPVDGSSHGGGAMNTGGKRRPGHNARYGID